MRRWDAEEARAAIEALERDGIEGSHIALLGSHKPGQGPDPTRPALGRMARLFVLGLVLGGAGGALIGWLAGIGGASAPLLWSIFGALVGGFVVAVSSFGVSRAWWRTFAAEHSGTLAVGVHTDDPDEADRAQATLGATQPMSLNRF